MPRPRLSPRIALLALLAALPACGEEEAPPAGPAPEEALLAALSSRVAEGRGLSDVTWTRDVQDVALALWPDDRSPAHLAARRDHTNLTHIAGDMADRLAGDASARAAWLASDPLSVRVHDGFVQAAAAGAAAYRAWVVGPGRALLEERFAALQGERPPR